MTSSMTTPIAYEHKLIDLSNKPQDFIDKYSSAVNGGPFPQVPLLEHHRTDHKEHVGDDGDGLVLITESIEVAKYVAEYVAPNDSMYPVEDSEKLALIDEFLQIWENHVTPSYYKCLTATSEKSADHAQRNFILTLQDRLQPILIKTHSLSGLSNEHGTGSHGNYGFLLGPTFSVAECVAAPWIQRFYFVLEHFRGIDFEDDILVRLKTNDNGKSSNNDDNQGNKNVVQTWMENVMQRRSVQQTECPHDEMAAAAMRYYVSYISPGSPASIVT